MGDYIPEASANQIAEAADSGEEAVVEDAAFGDNSETVTSGTDESNESEMEYGSEGSNDQPDLVSESEFVEAASETVDSVGGETGQDVDFVTEPDEPAQDPVQD